MANEVEYGVTSPFSKEPPSQHDLKLNDALMQEFKAQNNFAPQSETDKREAILKKLEALLQRMVQVLGKKKGLPAGILEGAGGRVFTYGSYRLGVYGPGTDVDTLMVAPKHVSRDDFFELMPDILRNAFTPDEIGQLVPVPGISTPIIKLTVQGVDIDLIFSNLQLSAIPKDLNLADDNLLRGLTDIDRRCVNGSRVTQRILEVVPQTKTFRLALRAVKLWAQKRAIYGNIVGYPGGVAWAILVARVCQLYPNAAAPVLIMKFFFVVKQWKWPQPVLLQRKVPSSLQLREWDPSTYRGDKHHLMPILTPAYPTMNTAHTVGPSTKMVLMQELDRGHGIITDIYHGKRPWKDLFQRHTFFTESYKHYICVITASKTKEAQDAWSGLTNSKIKWLIRDIEQSDANSVELVQPYNKGFERVHDCNGPEEIEKTLDGSMDHQVMDTKTTEQANNAKVQGAAQTDTDGGEVPAMDGDTKPDGRGPTRVWSTTYYLGIGLRKSATNLDISVPVKNYDGDCKAWDHYDKDLHSIRIKHIRNFNLPADVFIDGETRPTRPKKKTTAAANGAESANNKRSFSETGMDEKADPAKRRQSANGSSNTSIPNGLAVRPNGLAG